MRIHKEGRVTLLIVAALIVLFNYAALKLYPVGYLIYPLSFFSIIVYLLILWFFRVVERPVITDDKLVIAPCDGKVVVIEEVEENEFFKDQRLKISIFMSPLNVHMNWYPVGGKVLKAIHHKGKHLEAWKPKSSEDNERSTVVVETSDKKQILFRQIAGAMARRVVMYANEGEFVEQNGNLGFIKFGSRVDVYLPLNSDIKVELNQKTIGTQTILAHL